MSDDRAPPHTDERAGPRPNEDAIRLWLIDMATQHLSRNQGILGLGANAVQQSLREEKDRIVGRLQKLGARFEPKER